MALKVRRDDKQYSSNALENNILNKPNRVTYFLLRNGENLYRIWSSLDVWDVLFPRRDDFSDIFIGRDGQPMKPGTYEYEKAMKAADDDNKHYMRMVLFLQGLFDRTNFFHPFAKPGVNITNRSECESVIEFIHDAEMQLSDGRPGYSTWLRDLNDDLRVGSRIVGRFSYASGFPVCKNKNYDSVRVHPAGNCPNDYDLYILESRERGDGFKFLFEREREVWSKYEGYHKAKKKCSATVFPTDSFIINFDDLNPDDITYYMNCRLHRHEYLSAFPLLRRARAMKEKELADEAPFMKLLAGSIAKEHSVSIAEAEKALPRLVQWWKFKTRLTRALKSNDTKALRMIVEQYGILAKREADLKRRDKQVQPVVDTIRAKHPDAVFIGHKDKNTFVAMIAANDENIFVHEQTWRVTREKSVVMDQEKQWVLVDRRRDNWRKLYAVDRWEKWETKHHLSEILTDPERNKLVEDALQKYKESLSSKEEKGARFLPLAVTKSEDRNKYCLWVCEFKITIPRKRAIYRDIGQSSITRVDIHWKRGLEGVTHCQTKNSGYEWHPAKTDIYWMDAHPDEMGIGDTKKRDKDQWPWSKSRWYAEAPSLKLWPENLEIMRQEYFRVEEYRQRHNKLTRMAEELTDIVKGKWAEATERAAYEKFILENDPHLWEAEKKLKKQGWLWYPERDKLSELFTGLVDLDLPVMGKTLGWCFDQAVGKPKYEEKRASRFNRHRDEDDEDEKSTGLLPTEAELPGLDRNWVVQKTAELVEADL